MMTLLLAVFWYAFVTTYYTKENANSPSPSNVKNDKLHTKKTQFSTWCGKCVRNLVLLPFSWMLDWEWTILITEKQENLSLRFSDERRTGNISILFMR